MSVVRAVSLVVASAVWTLGCSTGQEAPRPPAQAGQPEPSALSVVSGQVPNPAPGTIVVLVPKQSVTLPQPTAPPVMDQVQMTFIPEMLIARAGMPVSFRSSDSEPHNINVRSPAQRFPEFNRTIPPGSAFEHVFKEPGFYDVRCDIHPSMAADIFVAPTPFAVSVGADGAFLFENVPPGPYSLTVYNGAATTEKEVAVAPGKTQVQFDGA